MDFDRDAVAETNRFGQLGGQDGDDRGFAGHQVRAVVGDRGDVGGNQGQD